MPDVQGEKIVIAAEEEAYLRSAFRRFALPYLIGLVAVTTFIFAMLFMRAAGAPVVGANAAIDPAALESLQGEIVALRAQFSQVSERVDELGRTAGGAARKVNELERRVEAATGRVDPLTQRDVALLKQQIEEASRRLAALEQREKQAEKRLSMAAPTDGDTAEVLREALERLYDVEARQEKEEAELKQVQRSLLDRVYKLEQRGDASMDERAQVERSLIERLKNLEDRFFVLERTANVPALQSRPPASPPPAADAVSP